MLQLKITSNILFIIRNLPKTFQNYEHFVLNYEIIFFIVIELRFTKTHKHKITKTQGASKNHIYVLFDDFHLIKTITKSNGIFKITKHKICN